ncbi:type IV pilus modification protein PilV [Pseudoduganella sp. UC29_106]|uniref:type IV pilus modification protein PilV n=1 Tax=Pseudoduganella sp. UC29_106 TaxID=3374553 RepID=UPI003757E301
MRNATVAAANAAAGFTLIEVLIATLVLALGLVGGVAMQLHAMRTRYESAQLSRAVQLAAGMAERIRANAAQTSAYVGFDYDTATDPHPPAFAPSAAPPRAPVPIAAAAATASAAAPAAVAPAPAPAACLDASCSPAELAGAELSELQRAVARQFATGRARICRDAQMWQARRLRWACTGGDTDPLVIKIGWRGKNPDGTPPHLRRRRLRPRRRHRCRRRAPRRRRATTASSPSLAQPAPTAPPPAPIAPSAAPTAPPPVPTAPPPAPIAPSAAPPAPSTQPLARPVPSASSTAPQASTLTSGGSP